MPRFKSLLKNELSDFLAVRKETVTSDYTYKHDCHILSHFDSYLCSIGCSDKNIMENELNAWIESIDGKSSTKASYVTVIRGFLKQLANLGYHPFVPASYKVDDDYIAYLYSEDDVTKIFDAADALTFTSVKYPYLGVEFPVILRLLYSCGLRLGEATQLKVGDVDFDNGTLWIKKPKNKRQRYVPMHEEMNNILHRYCLRLGNATHKSSYVFPGTDMNHELPSFNIRNQFNILKRKVGIYDPDHEPFERGACLHCFRHKFAFESFKQGERLGWSSVDQIPWLSIYMGHNSLDETQKYLRFGFDMYPEAMDLFDDYSDSIFPEVHFNDRI